ncbi:CubicO group peptidase, beta-lactamase class C family [Gracilibacillus ureilyticus]|uniref:CubicO group peptidase, beta-lactamase class C family n=1 Tax=Gracilibacillus ureilyticus TaxID=531814 RepID=A0A1H9PWV4_9BACI|nr:serine hydrolase domain-containing protein [Gracilibacillus ureilyticus]SER52249.1 CubicO group peptidase, beta-lactamase class C family [Gracilibacillus ureilyticus]
MMIKQRLDQLLKDFVENGPCGAALSVMKNSGKIYENYLGYANLEEKIEIDNKTIYRIFSMSKIVTCVAALQLMEQGKFLLTDPVSEYLPEFKKMEVYHSGSGADLVTRQAERPVLVKDLFKMTSGLVYGGNNTEVERLTSKVMEEIHHLESNGGVSRLRQFSKNLAELPLEFEPGTEWKYGLSHDILGALVEVVSGMPFGQYLSKYIFSPLQMNDTFFQIPDSKRHRLARLYDRKEDGTLSRNTIMEKHAEPIAVMESGGAGLYSTLSDYQKFAHCLAMGGTTGGYQLLSKYSIQLMSQNHLDSSILPQLGWNYDNGYGYGLGVRVMIDQTKGGSNSAIGEFGWSGLAGTYVFIDMENQLSTVYMQQMLPNFETYHQPRIRNMVYGSIE